MTTADRPWQREAACRGADPQLFDHARGGSGSRGRAVPGKAYAAAEFCRRCPVAADCLAFALALKDVSPEAGVTGTYGGHYFCRGANGTGKVLVTSLLVCPQPTAVA